MIKKFEEFINESSQYIWVDLIEREVDCSKITEQEFVEFILNDVAAAVREYASLTSGKYGDITYFDIQVDPSSMFAGSTIYADDEDEDNIVRIFNKIHNSKYFKLAKGWKITYMTPNDGKYKNSFGAKIKLTFDEAIQKEYNDEEKRRDDDVHRFYQKSKYNKYD